MYKIFLCLYYKKFSYNYIMKVQNYLLTEEIGSGSFSTVYKAVDVNDHSRVYAIKSMRQIPQNDEKAVKKQIDLLKEIKHKNVVNYIADFKQKNKWYIVFEYCGKGDLQNYLKKQARLPQAFCKNFASNIIDALSQLHDKGIAHRDLKLSNILINDQYDFKIADFGMAKIQKDGILESYCGTPYAMAPEVLKKEVYNIKCDTWSLGIMLYQLTYGKLPFDSRKNGGGIFGLTMSVLQDQPYFNPSVKVSDQCINFIKLCLRKDPNQRPAMQKLAQNPWLSHGVGSSIRKDFLKETFEQNTLQIIKKTKYSINQSVQQHIKKVIKEYKLIDTQIAKYFSTFDKYFNDKQKIKLSMVSMITKILKQISNNQVVIEIQKKKFPLKITEVQSYNNHMKNLKNLLKSILSKLNSDKPSNIERQIVSFVIGQSQACLTFDQNFPDKIQLLRYLAKLPLYSPSNTLITMKQGFSQITVKSESALLQFLDKLAQGQLIKIVNQNLGNEVGEKNWIVQHKLPKQRREGSEIELGEYISRVIDINCQSE